MNLSTARASARIWPQNLLNKSRLSTLYQALLPRVDTLAALPAGSRYLVLGLAGLIGLVTLVTVAAITVLELSSTKSPAWLEGSASSSAMTVPGGSKTYDNVVLRPLFSRVRSAPPTGDNPQAPVVQPTVAPAPMTLDQNMVVKGVFINGPLGKAFMTSPQNPTGRWIQINGEIDGWRLVEVEPERVVLNGQGQVLVLKRTVVTR